MKVKELKQLLNNYEDNIDVIVRTPSKYGEEIVTLSEGLFKRFYNNIVIITESNMKYVKDGYYNINNEEKYKLEEALIIN